MSRRLILAALAVAVLATPATGGSPQLEGVWAATSNTASAITGDITLGAGRLATRRGALPLVLTPVPGGDGGDPAWTAPVPARAGRVLLNGNTFCGANGRDAARWLSFTALPQPGRGSANPGLRVLAFETARPPAVLHGEATPGLCASFYYSRRER